MMEIKCFARRLPQSENFLGVLIIVLHMMKTLKNSEYSRENSLRMFSGFPQNNFPKIIILWNTGRADWNFTDPA